MKSVLQKARFFISSADDADGMKKKNAPKGVCVILYQRRFSFLPARRIS